MENRTRQVAAGLLAVLACICAWPLYPSAPQPRSAPDENTAIRLPDRKALQSGDIIFRRGRDAVSGMVLAADGRTSFSHVGIVITKAEAVWVIHASPAEGDETDGRVKVEPIEVFASTERASEIGIYRVRKIADTTIARVIKEARSYVGRPFDVKFDISDESQLYCTELVWRAYQVAGVELVKKFDHVALPLTTGSVIFPSSIADSSKLYRVI